MVYEGWQSVPSPAKILKREANREGSIRQIKRHNFWWCKLKKNQVEFPSIKFLVSFLVALRPRALPPNAARTAGRPGVQAGGNPWHFSLSRTSTWHVFDATITWYRRSKVDTRFWDLAKNPTYFWGGKTPCQRFRQQECYFCQALLRGKTSICSPYPGKSKL